MVLAGHKSDFPQCSDPSSSVRVLRGQPLGALQGASTRNGRQNCPQIAIKSLRDRDTGHLRTDDPGLNRLCTARLPGTARGAAGHVCKRPFTGTLWIGKMCPSLPRQTPIAIVGIFIAISDTSRDAGTGQALGTIRFSGLPVRFRDMVAPQGGRQSSRSSSKVGCSIRGVAWVRRRATNSRHACDTFSRSDWQKELFKHSTLMDWAPLKEMTNA